MAVRHAADFQASFDGLQPAGWQLLVSSHELPPTDCHLLGGGSKAVRTPGNWLTFGEGPARTEKSFFVEDAFQFVELPKGIGIDPDTDGDIIGIE